MEMEFLVKHQIHIFVLNSFSYALHQTNGTPNINTKHGRTE
jgi:hypothetical protein